MSSPLSSPENEGLRPESQRRTPPDRGIVLLDAKGRLGPQIWGLYGKVDRPVVLKDDLYLDNSLNDFCRDKHGRAFLLVPYVAPDAENRYEIADGAYRRAVALGITEKPEIFFTCLYQFQLPEYRCVHVHADKGDDVLEEEKCLRLMHFEKLRLLEQMGITVVSVAADKKIMPVTFLCASAAAEPSTNLQFAANTLVLHHGYDAARLQAVWDQY